MKWVTVWVATTGLFAGFLAGAGALPAGEVGPGHVVAMAIVGGMATLGLRHVLR